jgi:hypothetical protein
MWAEDRLIWAEDRLIWAEYWLMWAAYRLIWNENRLMWAEDRLMKDDLLLYFNLKIQNCYIIPTYVTSLIEISIEN